MSYMINLTNIIGEFPAWNLSTETRKNKYLEFEAPKRIPKRAEYSQLYQMFCS